MKSNSSSSYVCLLPPITTTDLTTGFTYPSACSVSYNTESGAVISDTVLAVCGYNRDTKFYCPWQMGDSGIPAMIRNLQQIMPIASKNCNSYIEGGFAQMYLCAFIQKNYPQVI